MRVPRILATAFLVWQASAHLHFTITVLIAWLCICNEVVMYYLNKSVRVRLDAQGHMIALLFERAKQ